MGERMWRRKGKEKVFGKGKTGEGMRTDCEKGNAETDKHHKKKNIRNTIDGKRKKKS